MDPFKSSDTTRASSLMRSSSLFIVLSIGLQIIMALVAYPFLPASVPSHWNAAGQINGYMPRLLNLLLMPAISTIIYICLRVIMAYSSKRSKRVNLQANLQFTMRLLTALFLFLLCLQLIIIAVAFGIAVDVDFFVLLFVSLLYIYMGNYMGKLRRNSWAGIKTPWALADDRVWERTHRLAGWLFVAVGGCGVLVSFMPALSDMRIGVVVGGILLITIVLYIYSYVVYRSLAPT